MSPSDNLRGAGFMMLSMAAFVLGDACIKAVAPLLPLYQAVTLRGLLTVPALALIAHLTGGLRVSLVWQARGLVGLRAMAEVAATVTFFAALLNLPLATVSAIMQSAPLAVTLGAALVFRERIGWRRLLAISLGFLGVLVIVRPGPEGFNIWAGVSLLTVLAVVVRDLATRRLPAGVPSVTVALVSAVAVAVVAAVLSLAEPWQPVSLEAALLIVAATVFVVVGYIFIIRVMRVGEVGVTAPFRYSALVWAVVLGWVLFAELPDLWTMVGASIVVGSGLFTLAREHRLRKRAPLVEPDPR